LENDTTLANCSFVTATLPASFTVSATENAKVLSVWIKDAAGNVSPRVDTGSVTLDTSAPSLAWAQVMNFTPTNTTDFNVAYGSVTGTYASYCILENSTTLGNCTFTNGTLPAHFTVSSTEEAKVLSVWIKDDAGNTSTRVDTNSRTLDTTAPTLASAAITNSSPTNTTTYGLSYGATTDTYNRYCILENDTTQANCTWNWSTLPASFTVSGTENAKVLSVWIMDAAGNASPRVDTGSVTLDTTVPALASATVSNTSPTATVVYALSYGAVTNGPYASYCILENDTTQANCSFTAGSLPASFNVAATENAKVLSIWIKDTAGNVSTRVDTNSVTLDQTAPALASVTISNSTPTNTTTYSLSYGSITNAPYNRYCILENSTTESSCTYTTGTLPASFAVSSTENAKVLSVWLKDAAGNVSTRVDSNSVTLDTSAPSLASATVSNATPTNTTTYSLSYGTADAYNRYCILENDTTLANCTFTTAALPSSFTVSSTENAKVLSVWIKDTAGNVSTRVDTNSVTLDTTAPTLASVTVSNATPTNTTTYSLSYGSVTNPPYNRYCILENDTTLANCSFVTATLPASFTVSATENAKVLSVWIKDAAGNVSARVDSNSVTLDTTAPTLASATVSNSSPTNTTTYSLSYGSITNTPYNRYCILENDTTLANCSFTTASLPASFTVSGTENAKVLSIWIKDAAGNVSARVDTNSVTLDTTAPTLASATVSNTSPTNRRNY
jgi:hypothetical protein